MPSKSHRAASRQAKLRQKRRRGKAAAQSFDAGPPEPTGAPAAVADDEPQPAPKKERPLAPSSRAARRARAAATDETAPTNVYLGSELRRIGAVTLGILTILAVLSFVLGG